MDIYLGVEYGGNRTCYIEVWWILSTVTQNGYTSLQWLYQFIPSSILCFYQS